MDEGFNLNPETSGIERRLIDGVSAGINMQPTRHCAAPLVHHHARSIVQARGRRSCPHSGVEADASQHRSLRHIVNQPVLACKPWLPTGATRQTPGKVGQG